jgi:hypothetical protein
MQKISQQNISKLNPKDIKRTVQHDEVGLSQRCKDGKHPQINKPDMPHQQND